MRTARALERHLEEDIVARHCVTILARRPSPPDAPSTPLTPGRSGRGRGRSGHFACSFQRKFWSVANLGRHFSNRAPMGKRTRVQTEPLKFVTTFPYRSEETEALGWRDVIVRACGRDERRTPRTSSRRVRRRGCSPCRFARRWGHASRRTNGTQPSTAQYRERLSFETSLKG